MSTNLENRMATEKLSLLVIKLSIPTIISMVVSALYNVVDRFWIGKMEGIGASALAGIGICMPIMNIIMGFSMLVAIGAASRISISLGEREQQFAEKVLGNAFTLTILFAAFSTIGGLLTLKPLLLLVGATENSLPYAIDYMSIILIGSTFAFLSFSMNHPIRAAGNSVRFATTQIIGTVVNIILDPILIFGFNMGIKGAAWATIIAQLVTCVWIFAYFFGKKSVIKFKFKNLKPDFAVVASIFSIGLSPFLMQVAASFISAIANRTLQYYGELEIGSGDMAISSMTIVMSLFVLLFMPILGINQGVQPIIGFNFGAKNYERVRDAFKWSVIYSIAMCTAGFLVVEMFAPQMILIFNDDPSLVSLGAKGARIFLASMPLLGFLVPATNFFQAIGRAKISIILSLLRQVIVLVPAYFILPKLLGLNGAFMANPLSDIISTVVAFVYIIKEFKLLKIRFEQENKQVI